MSASSAEMHERQRGPRPGSMDANTRPIGALSRGHRKLHRQRQFDSALGRGLGWLSLGLGAGGLFASSALGEAIGLPRRNALLQMAGARELLAGIGLLTQEHQRPWLWARVVGDMMDLAVLGMAAQARRPRRQRRAVTALGVVAAVTAIDVLASVRASRSFAGQRHSLRRVPSAADEVVGESIVINKSPTECYEFWRKLEQLPRFMWTLESVVSSDNRRSHWVVAASPNTRIEWDAEITHDVPGERLAWRSVPNKQIAHAGAIRFAPAPGDRGTLVHLVAHYRLLAGAPLVPHLARMLSNAPAARLREELRRFKQLIETGEIPTTEGQPHGTRSLLGKTLQRWRSA